MGTKVHERASAISLLLLRLGAGAMLIYQHGWPKLAHFGERLPTFANPIGLGSEVSFVLVVFAEVVCAAAVMLGLFTRAAVVPLIIFFVVAALVQHGADPFARKELPLLYGFVYAAIGMMGPGAYSIDALRRRG